MKNFFFIGIVLSVLLLMLSCNDDRKLEKESDWREVLRGEWLLESATRQGIETGLLEDLYLVFNDSTLELNYPDTMDIRYELNVDTVILDNHVFGSLEILSANEEKLNLGFDHQKNYFSLVFSRIK